MVRLNVKMGYNFFQYLGPNKTRHVTIWNTDPQIDYIPTVFLNYMMTNVLYAMMTELEKFASNLTEDKEHYKYYKRKQPYYDFFVNVMLDPTFYKIENHIRVKDCPDHPANANHPEHDPNHPDNWKPRYGA